LIIRPSKSYKSGEKEEREMADLAAEQSDPAEKQG
jgi:hypothetical protein